MPARPSQLPALNGNDGVADGTRTRDNWNHNPGLYQLSYSHQLDCRAWDKRPRGKSISGLPDGNRTHNPQLRRLVLYPVELRAGASRRTVWGTLVGVRGFEPPTSCSQSRHATRLRHTPEARYYNCLPADGSICPARIREPV